MPTNRGEALLNALRVVLLTVAGLPTARLWQNQRAELMPTAASVADEILLWDTRARELGSNATGAWRRSEVLYRVQLRVPKGTDAHAMLALMMSVQDAFYTAAMTIDGQPVTIEDIRVGPVLPEPHTLYAPVAVALTFDHA